MTKYNEYVILVCLIGFPTLNLFHQHSLGMAIVQVRVTDSESESALGKTVIQQAIIIIQMGSTTEAGCSGRGVALGGFSEGSDIQMKKRGTEGEGTEQGAVRRVFLATTGCGQQQQAKPRLALSQCGRSTVASREQAGQSSGFRVTRVKQFVFLPSETTG